MSLKYLPCWYCYTKEYGAGFIAFSPLAQGVLTDKYLNGIPEDSRAAKPTGFLRKEQVSPLLVEKVNGESSKDEKVSILGKYGITDKHVKLWGTGKPLREFLWSEEMADACVFIMENVDFSDLIEDKKEIRNCHINIGTGKEISIHDLALLIKETIGYDGEILFDDSKPDGTMRKLTDVTKLNNLGWKHKIEVEEGVQKLYNWYIQNI
jgi:GDP-L-fucose synthase